MRYIRYARKSEPDEGRQEQSIEQQRAIMLQDAERRELCVVKEIEESVSAKVPGKRPGFREMMCWLRAGRADAILVYHENRLARNPLESGELQQLLQDGVIREIRTHESVYRPEDNALLFAVISSMSNQYSRDLSVHVKRGMDGKRAAGWYPHRAPEGYRNNTYDHTIEVDEERFALIRKAWDLMLTGSYSVPQVRNTLNNTWGYRTKPMRRSGGGPLSRTALYKIFSNVFYTGNWMEKGVLYPGKHRAMVTLQEFHRVQHILCRPGKAQPQKHDYAYTGLIRCGACGSMITAETHPGRHGRGTYIYYRCSDSRGTCTRVSISEPHLERQVDRLLQSIEIDATVLALAGEELDLWKEQPDGCEEMRRQQQRALAEAERKMGRLVEMYLNELFDNDDDYRERKATLQQEINGLRTAIAAAEQESEQVIQTARNALNFAAHAGLLFLTGTTQHKREIAGALGVDYVLTSGAVSIQMHPALEAICRLKQQNNQPETASKTACPEPLETGSGSIKKTDFCKPVPFGWPEGSLFRTFKDLPYFPMLPCLNPDFLAGSVALPSSHHELDRGIA